MGMFFQIIGVWLATLMAIPVIAILCLWALVYGYFLLPVSIIWLILYLKHRKAERDEVLPKPVPKPVKTIDWHGHSITIWTLIWSILIAILITPFIIYAMLFVLPPIVTACILGYSAAHYVGKNAKKK